MIRFRILPCQLLLVLQVWTLHAVAQETAMSPVDQAKEHLRRGQIALEKGDLQDGCFEFRSATLVLPNWWAPPQEYIRCARLLGTAPEELLAVADQILQIDGTRPTLHHLRGVLLEDLSRHDEARAAYERAYQLAPWMASVVGGLARMALRAGQPAVAREVCEKAIGMRPSDVLLLRYLAEAQGALGDLKAQIVTLERLVGASNRPSEGLTLLARAYKKTGNESKYKETLIRLRKIAKSGAEGE